MFFEMPNGSRTVAVVANQESGHLGTSIATHMAGSGWITVLVGPRMHSQRLPKTAGSPAKRSTGTGQIVGEIASMNLELDRLQVNLGPLSCLVMLAPIGPTGSMPSNGGDAREVAVAQLSQCLEMTSWAMRMMPRHHPHSDVVFVSLPSLMDADGHDLSFSGLTHVTQTFKLELGDSQLR